MNKCRKLGFAVAACGASITALHLINKKIAKTATQKNITANSDELVYEWKFGKVAYTKSGKGSPVLLLHDLSPEASSYEWKRIKKALAEKHTVYTIDLLGCGHSEKPDITYTIYMYTQLLNDFILHVINKRVDIITSKDSSTIALMSAISNPLAYDNIILINPQNPVDARKGPDHYSRYRKCMLNIPVIGTFIYNMCVRRDFFERDFTSKNFYNKHYINKEWLEAFNETAHIGGAKAKYVYLSKDCGYTTAEISRAVKTLNKISIINGKENASGKDIVQQFLNINPTISTYQVTNSKLLPQLEQPLELNKILKKILK